MKYLLTIFTFLLMSIGAAAQKPYSISKDDETGATIFKGAITMADLSGEHSFDWFRKGEASYKPDSAVIKYLRAELPAYTIVAVMGTWCDDSQNLIPKLSKVLQAARFPMSRYVMYGVDRAKETGGVEKKIFQITRVPTIIVYKDNKEIGRIVESVSTTVESELVQILR